MKYLSRHEINFAKLLDIVAKSFPKFRIRFTTSNPQDMDNEVLITMKAHKNICNHIHLPVQSGSDKILKETKSENFVKGECKFMVKATIEIQGTQETKEISSEEAKINIPGPMLENVAAAKKVSTKLNLNRGPAQVPAQVPAPVPAPTPIEELPNGTPVEARLGKGNYYYSGTIVKKNGDDTYKIKYDDGSTEENVERKYINIYGIFSLLYPI